MTNIFIPATLVQAPVPIPVANTAYPKPIYSPDLQYPYFPVTSLPSINPTFSDASASPNTTFGTSMSVQETHEYQQYLSPSSSTPISKSITTSASTSLAPPSMTVIPPTTTDTSGSSSEMLYDLTRRSASPTSSGVQIDLINLRQKLSRDVQNNMKIVTDQHGKIKDLQNKANEVETGYSHLKCDLEDLKRKKKEQDGKLKEIDSLLKSALTMSSFSSTTALQVEMVEDEDGMDGILLVAVTE